MSLPFSRLVVNPCDFWYPTEPIMNSPEVALPFSAGYYAGGDAVRLENIWQMYERSNAAAENAVAQPLSMEPAAWIAESNARVEPAATGLRLTATGASPQCPMCSAIRQEVDCEVTSDTWIRVTVPEAVEAWSLKVSNGEGKRECTIQRDIVTTGTRYYNLGVMTGWRGKQRIRVSFYAATLHHPVTLKECALMQLTSPALRAAQHCETSWAPHELVTTASYSAASAVSRDAFADENSVVRTVQLSKAGHYALAGVYDGGISWNNAQHCLVVQGTTCTYAICFPTQGMQAAPKFYANELDLVSDRQQRERPPQNHGYWCVPYSATAATTFSCGFGFATLPEQPGTAAKRAQTAAKNTAAEQARSAERRWNAWLAKVPRLENYTIYGVDSLGVTADDVRRAYYKAWVFFEADFLPRMPETGFSFVQLACGKPSLWAEGHPKARPTASWDSLFAMQMEAYVRPDAAWESFTGLMSLVDEDGALWGESLPSRKAQTARVLFDQTHDVEKLKAVYPALKRHVLWAERNPRWIYREHNSPDEKDADFVVSLLVDFEHMRVLAQALGITDDASQWQQHRQ
jgi:hypothetical protein